MNEQNNLYQNKIRVRWWDWFSAILLIVILQIAAARLVATLWTKNLHTVQMIAFLGTILGLALGKSIFGRFWVVYLSAAYGLILIPWQFGLMLDPEIRWPDRLINLWGRLGAIISDILSKRQVTDNLLFLLLMTLLFWVLGITAGYILVREANPWKVVIPGGITIFVIHSFDPLLVSRSWYLAFYLFFSLILIARMVYLRNTAKWKESRTHTPPDIGFDFSRIALLLSMVLVFFAWNVPVVAESFKPAAQIWQTASRPWLSAKDRFSFVFASLRASVGLVQNFYGDTLALGLGSRLSDQVVMEVEAPTDLPNSYRLYWKARSYTTYEDNHWLTDIKSTKDLSANSVDLNQPGKDVRPIISTTFFPHQAISTLYSVPEPLWSNIPIKAYLNNNPDGTVDFGNLTSNNFVRPGEQYTIRSAVDAVKILDLKDAGTTYPQWILDEYLQLPSNITPRTRELADQIASGLSNSYDITDAVTQYLRENIQYTLTIDTPPPNQERVDWFLFDYKKGFCNYYASAEVILLRSLGIPARMAVGFAQGERELAPIEIERPRGVTEELPPGPVSEVSTYIVRQKDAHAWPEVYFPGIGWVIFEPTVSQPPLFRPSGESIDETDQDQTNQDQNNPENQPQALENTPQPPVDRNSPSGSTSDSSFWTFSNIVKLGVFLAAIVVLAIVIWQTRRGFKLKPFLMRMSLEIPEGLERGLRTLGIRPPDFLVNWIYYLKLPALSRSYLEINRALKRVGEKSEIHETPLERTTDLINAIPSTQITVARLLAEYQTSIYSPYSANEESGHLASLEIRKLSIFAWLRRILARFQEPN